MAARFAFSGLRLTDKNGKKLTSGKINFWDNGTTNNQTTWKEAALNNSNVNPVILDADGVVPEIWAANAAVFSFRITDSADNVMLATVDDLSFLGAFSLTSADVLAVLDSNSAAVVINGSAMTGTAFTAFASALTLTAAGTIDTATGAITVGTVNGTPTFSGVVTHGANVVSDADSTDDLGTTSVRWLNLYVDKITLTGGAGGLTVDNTENTGIADAYGTIVSATVVNGVGIASVSSSGTGIWEVVFDNAADTTAEQCVVVTPDNAGGNNSYTGNANPTSATETTVRVWTSETPTPINTFPISIVRFLFT